MGEYTHRERPDPAPASLRSWLIATGIATTVGLALLWSTHEAPYPSPLDGRAITLTASESTRNASSGTDRSPVSTARPVKPLPLTAVESEETSPFTIEPTSIANHVARLLGGTPDLDIGQLGAMLDTAQDPDLPLEDRITAIRWLARTGNDEAIDALERLLLDDASPSIRAAAATALGQNDDAANNLRLAFAGAEGALAHQIFTENEPDFRELLADPDTPVDMKVEAIDALGEGTPEAADLLLELARNADDPVLRSTAIDALALFDEPGDALDALGELVLSESSAEVRADLYNTLSLHADMANAGSIAPGLVLSTLSETAPRPQLEGYRMVASMLHDQYQPGLAETFDKSMVTWLQDAAEHGDERYTRHLSVDALRMANTPGAYQALLDLSYSADPAVSRLAEKALRLAAKTGSSHAP